MQDWQRLRILPHKRSKKYSLKIKKIEKTHSFQGKKFIRMFLRTSRLQFWQPRQKIFQKTLEIFPVMSKKDLRNAIFRKNTFFSIKDFYGHVECRFDIADKKKKYLFLRKQFLTKCFYGQKKAVFKPSRGIFGQKAGNFLLSFQN